jgi:probable phosphoglycerate mutase
VAEAAPGASERRLLLVRHGQTAWNAEGRAQGHADVSLDDTGRAQAETMAAVVAGYEPEVLVSSDLARARETAAFLEKATGLTCVEDPRLREYDVGERTGLTREEFAETGGGEASWDVHAHVDVPGAETAEQVSARIVPAVRSVLTALSPGATAVVVTHGASGRVAVCGLLDWPLEAYDALGTLDNCAWVVLAESRTGRLRLAAYNLTVPD